MRKKKNVCLYNENKGKAPRCTEAHTSDLTSSSHEGLTGGGRGAPDEGHKTWVLVMPQLCDSAKHFFSTSFGFLQHKV